MCRQYDGASAERRQQACIVATEWMKDRFRWTVSHCSKTPSRHAELGSVVMSSPVHLLITAS